MNLKSFFQNLGQAEEGDRGAGQAGGRVRPGVRGRLHLPGVLQELRAEGPQEAEGVHAEEGPHAAAHQGGAHEPRAVRVPALQAHLQEQGGHSIA